MPLSTALSPSALSKPALQRYLIALGIAYLAVVIYLLLEKGPRLWGPALGLPVVLAIVTSPRLAMYQFLFCLLVDLQLIASPAIYLVDLSGALLVMSAVLDVLLNPERRSGRAPMTTNYFVLIGALSVAAMFSVQPGAAAFPLARVMFLFAVFLSLVRLSSVVSFADSLRAFFVLTTIHAVFAAAPSIASGGRIRSFGFAGTAFDDIAMLIVPCGLSVYLWSKSASRLWYLAGAFVILAALIGTQSRFAILICGLLCVAVALLSLVQARRLRKSGREHPEVGRRAFTLTVWLVALLLVLVIAVPSLVERALARFDAAVTTTPGGTMLLRLTLWKAAIKVFWDHPLVGIGPGVFRSVDQYYGALWFGPTYPFVRGLSAHNLFLHYLAEAGIVGVLALLALFFSQFRHAVGLWRRTLDPEKSSQIVALAVVSAGIFFTTFLEGSWMWGATGFAATYFIAFIAAEHRAEPSAILS